MVASVRGKSEVGSKSDRIDADDLSEMLRAGTIKAVYHGAAQMLTLKHLMRCCNTLVQARRE